VKCSNVITEYHETLDVTKVPLQRVGDSDPTRDILAPDLLEPVTTIGALQGVHGHTQSEQRSDC